MDVDMPRVERVVAHIGTGIFFHETGRALATGFSSEAGFAEAFVDPADPEAAAFYRTVLARAPKVIGGGAFSYRFVKTAELEDATVTWMTFFDALHFVCFTSPDDDPSLEGAESGEPRAAESRLVG